MRATVAILALAACGYPQPADRCDGTCAVFAIDRPIAQPGTVITLEGTFDRDSRVQFPGLALTVPLDSYGPHRVQVTVPDNATAGPLVLQTNTNYTEPFPFRATTFRPELQAFRDTYEQTDVGRFLGASSLFERIDGAAVVAGPRIYLIGGRGASGIPSRSIDSMLVNADDSLSDVTSSLSMLETARSGHACVVIGPAIYAIGGTTSSGTTDTVEGTTLDPMFNVGGFNVLADVKLTVPRVGHAATVIGNYVYVVGGNSNDGDLGTLERAPIYNDGIIGTFEAISGIELRTPRSGHSLAVVGNYLYVIGGTNRGNPVDSIERIELFPDGYVGAPSEVGTLAVARSEHTSVVVGDSIYVIGGEGRDRVLDSVERFAIADTLTSADAGTLRTQRSGAMLVSAGNHVYVLGGRDDQGKALATFERASIIGHATTQAGAHVMLENFTNGNVTVLGTPRSEFSTLVLGDTLYVIGGFDGAAPLKTIEKATINADGTLGAFGPADVILNVARAGHASFIYNNDVYVLGGRTSSDFMTFTASMERAHIGPDGALGPFEQLGNFLDVPRGYFSVAMIGRAVYVLAGATTDTTTQPTVVDTVKLTLLDEGVGAIPALQPHSTLPTARGFHVQLILPTAATLFTGITNGGGYLAGVTAAIDNLDVLGSWTGATNNPSNREGCVLATLGDAVFAIGGVNVGSAATSEMTQRASIDGTGAVSPFELAATALATPRYRHSAVTIGNRVYILGGVDTSDTTLRSVESSTIH